MRKDISVFGLLVLTGRVGFLFADVLATPEMPTPYFEEDVAIHEAVLDTNHVDDIPTLAPMHTSADNIPAEDYVVQEEKLTKDILSDLKTDFQMELKEIESLRVSQVQSFSDSILEDIRILEKLYKKENNPLVLKVLVEKLSQDYQFDNARAYAEQLLTSNTDSGIDPSLYLDILLNSSDVSIIKPSSIEKVRPKIEEARIKGQLSTDAYRYYQSLLELWYGNYDDAWTLLKQIDSPLYSGFVSQMGNIFREADMQRDMPEYYQDALISLNLLKHGQFSVAKKIALDVLGKDDQYILPYQILAYSHFLTNNRNAAIDYFFKLSNYDPNNASLYKFLLGVSYYRQGKYEQSVIHLSQVEKAVLEDTEGFSAEVLLADTYRYLILNYQARDDQERLISTWKKLLGQDNLQKSDFYGYFYEALFQPFIEGEDFELYTADPQLGMDYVDRCEFALQKQDEDVCMYGRAGLLLLQQKGEEAKQALLYLAEHYPQSYIFHTLGDYYYQESEYSKAKQYYIKAISMPVSENEEAVLKDKLTEFAIQR